MAKMSADFYAIFPRLRVQIPLATCDPQYCANLLAGTFTRSYLAQSFGCAGCLGAEPYARSFETIDSNARAKSVTPV